MKATVLGWYGHGNAGDESYKTTFPLFFEGWNLSFSDRAEPSEVTVLGGGHVCVPHFLGQIRSPTKYAFSVSVAADAPFELMRDFRKIFVRDALSAKHLRDHGIPCEVAPDAALLMTPDRHGGEKIVREMFAGKQLYEKLVVVVLNAHLMPDYQNFLARDYVNFQGVVAKLAAVFDSAPASFLFVPFGQKDPHDDRNANGWLASRCKFWQKNAVARREMSPQELLDVIAFADAAVTTRLHAAVFCCAAGTPFVDVTHHDKNRGFLEEIDRSRWSVPYWDFDGAKCKSLIEEFLRNDAHGEELELLSRDMRKRILDVRNL